MDKKKINMIMKGGDKYQAKKYKYNNARVKKITHAMCNIEYFEDNYDE